jgi:general nucleoside transport system permease protein
LRRALRALRTVAIQLAAVSVGLVASALVLATMDVSPWEALTSLLDGAFGSTFALEQSALKAIPLALTGLAVALCLRMRLWNIGAEGQFHAGAIGASWAALAFPTATAWLLLPLMVVAGMVAGAAWAALAAVPRALWGVNEIITTLLLNYVAILAVAYLVTGPWRSEASFNLPVSDQFGPGTVLPKIGDSLLHIGVLFPLIAALVLLVLLNRSKWGYEVRMIGASPDAARLAGMSIVKNILVIMLAGGALAGVAGMIEVSTSFGRLRQGISPGYGYMAIVIAALAAADVLGTLAVAFLFGGFIVGAFALQALGVPQAFVLLLQGIILFCALAGSQLAGGRLTPWTTRLRGRGRPAVSGEEELATP